MSELSTYLATGAVYVALGVAFPELLFSWPVGAGFLLAGVWLVPALVRRLLR